MWVVLAILSALCLGCYDISKKLSLRDNNVLVVLFLNTLFCTLLMMPTLLWGIAGGNWGMGNTLNGHIHIVIKSVIVLTSWILGYFSIKHLPLTISGPVNASRPVMVLVGAVLIFGERLNAMQWIGVALGFGSLFLISRIGGKEGFSLRHSKWLWMSIGAAAAGAVSALYDKALMQWYKPLEVQGWYNFYQLIIMGALLGFLISRNKESVEFRWRWSILLISVFLTIADLAYFYALSAEGSLVAIVSMIRRGSVLVSFVYGFVMLHEKNIRAKSIDLSILLVGLIFLVVGSL